MTIYEWVAIMACVVGGGMGAYAMINPAWVSRLVRLAPMPDKVEGRSEFRGTLGGLFFASHAFAAWALASGMLGAEMAAATLGLAWLGSGAGRTISLFADDAMTRLNVFNVFFEIVLGVGLLLPLLMR